jgi:hypothetical protein
MLHAVSWRTHLDNAGEGFPTAKVEGAMEVCMHMDLASDVGSLQACSVVFLTMRVG